MDISKKPALEAGEKWFDGIVRAVAVWGTALAAGELTNRLLIDLISRSWRVGLSLIASYVVVAAIFWGGKRWPRLTETFFAWRYPIAILLAAYVSYQWHAHN